jgi:hypothetical protein
MNAARASLGGSLAALTVVAALSTSACGLRTDPRPPEHTMPRRPANFAVSIENNEVRLGWSRPDKSEDGRALLDLAGFRIERSIDEGEFEVLADVAVRDRERIRPQNRFKWRDLDPLRGRSFYRVRAYTDDGQTGTVTPIRPVDVSEAVLERARELRAEVARKAQVQAAPASP